MNKSTLSTLITFGVFILVSCGGGNGGTGPALGTVTPLYAVNGANWNDYVKDDGADVFSATDTLCDSVNDMACLHGGEMQSMVVPNRSDCEGLTAADSLDIFNWSCDTSATPVRFVSTGIKDTKSMSDLIDFDSAAFRENALQVRENGSVIVASDSSTWWNNPIVVNNDGSNGSDMTEGEIHLVTTDPKASYVVGADRVALLVKPGVILTGSANANEQLVSGMARNFLWIEGTIDGAGEDSPLSLSYTRFSVLNNLNAENSAYSGASISYSSRNKLRNINVRNNNLSGIAMLSSGDNSLINIIASDNTESGINFYLTENSTLHNIVASGNAAAGVYLWSFSDNNRLSNITANSNGNGIVLSSSSNNHLSDITTDGNGYGIALNSSSNNNLLSSVTTIENDYGIYLNSSSNLVLSNITASANVYTGIYLYLSSNNSFSNITASGNTLDGIYLDAFSNNSLSNITVSANSRNGIRIASSDNNYVTGQLLVGNNLSANCFVFGGTNPGLVNGTCSADGTDGSSDYGANSSDAILTTAVSVSGSFVDASSGDYTLLASDNIIRGILDLPSGSDTYTHTWSDNSTTVLLRNATEIINDGLGNDNGLCESTESCLYTPNIGVYQGHGPAVSAGAFTNGTISGVTLLRYETNGY